MRFEPEGRTTHTEIPLAKSLPDYIMRWLASRFMDTDSQEELGILTPAVRARKMGQDISVGNEGGTAGPSSGAATSPAPATPATTPLPAAAAMTDKPPVIPARLVGIDVGPACQQCGGIMQRTGSCYTCPPRAHTHRRGGDGP